MPVDAQADGLYVLSDLHLAPPGEQCVFAAHAPLVALLDRIATSPSPSPQWLVLNGDVFDFLQIPGYEQFARLGGERIEQAGHALRRQR